MSAATARLLGSTDSHARWAAKVSSPLATRATSSRQVFAAPALTVATAAASAAHVESVARRR